MDERELIARARENALRRVTEKNGFMEEILEAFRHGLSVGLGDSIYYTAGGVVLALNPSDAEELKVYVMERCEPDTNYAFGFIAGLMAVVEAKKGKAYKASWFKRGEEGAFDNISRKYDRLQAAIEHDIEMGDVSDTVGDLSVYGMKLLSAHTHLRTPEFVKWVTDIIKLQ